MGMARFVFKTSARSSAKNRLVSNIQYLRFNGVPIDNKDMLL